MPNDYTQYNTNSINLLFHKIFSYVVNTIHDDDSQQIIIAQYEEYIKSPNVNNKKIKDAIRTIQKINNRKTYLKLSIYNDDCILQRQIINLWFCNI